MHLDGVCLTSSETMHPCNICASMELIILLTQLHVTTNNGHIKGICNYPNHDHKLTFFVLGVAAQWSLTWKMQPPTHNGSIVRCITCPAHIEGAAHLSRRHRVPNTLLPTLVHCLSPEYIFHMHPSYPHQILIRAPHLHTFRRYTLCTAGFMLSSLIPPTSQRDQLT